MPIWTCAAGLRNISTGYCLRLYIDFQFPSFDTFSPAPGRDPFHCFYMLQGLLLAAAITPLCCSAAAGMAVSGTLTICCGAAVAVIAVGGGAKEEEVVVAGVVVA